MLLRTCTVRGVKFIIMIIVIILWMGEVIQIFSDTELVTDVMFFTVVHDIICQNCDENGNSSAAECQADDQKVMG